MFFHVQSDAKKVDFGLQQLMLKTTENSDLEWLEAVAQEIVGPFLHDHSVLSTVIKETAIRGPSPSQSFQIIAEQYDRLNKRRDRIAQAITTGDFSCFEEDSATA